MSFAKFMIWIFIPATICLVAYVVDGNLFGPVWTFDMGIYVLASWSGANYGKGR